MYDAVNVRLHRAATSVVVDAEAIIAGATFSLRPDPDGGGNYVLLSVRLPNTDAATQRVVESTGREACEHFLKLCAAYLALCAEVTAAAEADADPSEVQ